MGSGLLLRLAEALGDTGRPLEAATLGYAQAVLNNEWPAMQQPGSATEFLGALRNLARAVLAPDLIAAVPTAVHQTILDGMVEIRQARRDRLSLLAGESDSMSWLAMLILGVLTQVAVAVVQLDRLRPQALALFVFTSAFAATVVLIGLSEHDSPVGTSMPRRFARRWHRQHRNAQGGSHAANPYLDEQPDRTIGMTSDDPS